MRLPDFILANLEPIMAEWEIFARSIWPNQSGSIVDPATLRNDAENMLRAAVNDMRSGQSSIQQSDKSKGRGRVSRLSLAVDQVSTTHGSERYASRFGLPAIIAEYRALRASVIRLWGEAGAKPNSDDLKDLTRFNEAIDQSLSAAVVEFLSLVERDRLEVIENQSRDARRAREVELSLRDTEQSYRTLVDQVKDYAIFTVDLQGRATTWNQGVQTVLDFDEDEFVGHDITEAIFTPEDVFNGVPQQELDEAAESGAASNDRWMRRKNGERFFAYGTTTALKDEYGRLKGFIKVMRDQTGRMLAETRLRESEALHRFSMQAASAGTWTWDATTGAITWSKECYELFGIDPATPLSYESWRDALHPDDRGRADAAAIQAMERRENLYAEYRVRHPLRGERWLNSVGRVLDPVNRPGYMAGLSQDITERKLAETAIRFLASIVNASSDAIIGETLEGIIQSWNPAAERMFGYAAEEAIGRHISLIIPNERASEQVRILARLRAGERIEHFDTVRVRKNGSLLPVSLNISPIRNEAGRVVGASKIARDITDRKQVEAAIEISETRYRRIFEAAKDGILVLDFNDGRITDANPFMADLLGHPREHFLGKELWEIGLFPDKLATENAVRDIHRKGVVRFDHLRLDSRRGEEIEVDMVANIYLEGETPVIQCNLRDTTERSRLEWVLKDQRAALLDLHRRKDEFLAMLSHELRNPLAPIVNAVELLRLQTAEDPLQQTAREIIERQVGQLKRLVDDLLEVSRITTGRIQLRLEKTALKQVIENAVETVRAEIERRRHALIVTLPTQQVWLDGDAARLEQVFVNLLANAAKYTEEGGRVELELQSDGDEAVVRVRDTGVGIGPEFLPRIFDLFTQSERSLDRSQGGLGIGLSLVQRLVEMHRGRIEAFSTLGKGSEFVVRLPIAQPSSAPAPAAMGAVRPPGRSLRVLVVDDSRDVRHTLSLLLPRHGHEVQTASDGPSAIEAALAWRPDVALLDIGLPAMDGYELARHLRQQDSLRNLVLVALTGYGQETDRQRALEAGFDHHLVKPADIRKVLEVLATVPAGPKSNSADPSH